MNLTRPKADDDFIDPLGQGRRYSAFISYSDADRAAAFKLHEGLERYRLPKNITGLGGSRLKPVCIDRAEMPAAPDLGDAIIETLADTDFLIVVCTPNTPGSYWVGREIEAFHDLHGSGRILAALFDGDEKVSFHSSLVDLGAHAQPLAADFRQGKDGFHNGLLKLVAALAGVPLDELIHRDAKRNRKRQLAWAGGVTAIALVIGGFGYSAYQSNLAAQQEQIDASMALEMQLDDLRDEIRAGGTLRMAEAVTRNIAMFYQDIPEGQGLPEVELGRARLLHTEAEDNILRGELDLAEENAQAALRITGGIFAREPDDERATLLHAHSAYWVGLIAWRKSDTPLAANAFARYAELAQRLVMGNPQNIEYLQELGYASSNLGVVALREAQDPILAEKYFSDAMEAFKRVAEQRPNDLDAAYEIADGEAWLADSALMAGDISAAIDHRKRQREMLSRLLEEDPGNLLYRLDELRAGLGSAVLDYERGEYAGSIKALRQTLAKAEDLVDFDPANQEVKGQKRAIELYLARSELERAGSSSSAIGRAQSLIGDCNSDWDVTMKSELPVFCYLLRARLAAMKGEYSVARNVMSDPRLIKLMQSEKRGDRLQSHYDRECGKIGIADLCK